MEVRGIPVEVVRKDIKNLHLGVYPPSGRVRVAAPLRLNDEAVRLAVISRLGWIHRRQAEFEQQGRQSQRELVAGESHYFQGRRYRLDVIEDQGSPSVRLSNGTTMGLRVRRGSDRDTREAASAVVSEAAPRAAATPSRQVGTQSWRDRFRRAHQEDEDPLGQLQCEGPPHLAESGVGQETGIVPGVHPGSRNGPYPRATP